LTKTSLKLDKIAFEELLELRDEVETALDGKIAVERRELQNKLAEMDKIERRSMSRASVAKSKAGSRRGLAGKVAAKTPVAPKYRGPDGQTWAGRGLAPKWLVEKKGRKREQLLIATA
jgi:DNA-binding protein H-NS